MRLRVQRNRPMRVAQVLKRNDICYFLLCRSFYKARSTPAKSWIDLKEAVPSRSSVHGSGKRIMPVPSRAQRIADEREVAVAPGMNSAEETV